MPLPLQEVGFPYWLFEGYGQFKGPHRLLSALPGAAVLHVDGVGVEVLLQCPEDPYFLAGGTNLRRLAALRRDILMAYLLQDGIETQWSGWSRELP